MAGGKLDKALQQAAAMFGGCTKIKVLWANASPASSFYNQKISVGLSGYSHVVVVANIATSVPTRMAPAVIAPVGRGGELVMSTRYSADLNYRRQFTSAAGYVNFDECSSISHVIPCYICGVKI